MQDALASGCRSGHSRTPATTAVDGLLVTLASNGCPSLVQHASISQIQDDLEIQLNCADCVGTALSAADTAENRQAVVAIFRRLVHGILEQFRCSLGCPADQIMQATEAAGAEFLAASLQPDAVTMTLDHDETLVPY